MRQCTPGSFRVNKAAVISPPYPLYPKLLWDMTNAETIKIVKLMKKLHATESSDNFRAGPCPGRVRGLEAFEDLSPPAAAVGVARALSVRTAAATQ